MAGCRTGQGGMWGKGGGRRICIWGMGQETLRGGGGGGSASVNMCTVPGSAPRVDDQG